VKSRIGDEKIREIVAENVGRIFINYSWDIYDEICNSMKSPSSFERATVAKSFKFAA
jgi:hypothetical protein